MNSVGEFSHVDSAKNFPDMTGKKNSKANHELHIFLLPHDPDHETVQKFFKVVTEWNKQHPSIKSHMEACYLGIPFRRQDGSEHIVHVIQSARYFKTNDTAEAINQVHNDARWFAACGFEVDREKIEASVYGTDGIPLTHDEAAIYTKNCFEFHINIGLKSQHSKFIRLSEQEANQLKELRVNFSKEFQTPVLSSYNINEDQLHGDRTDLQRFIDLRFRKKGFNEIKPLLDRIKRAINDTEYFKVLKVLHEFIWYDTNPSGDQYSIEYAPEELQEQEARKYS